MSEPDDERLDPWARYDRAEALSRMWPADGPHDAEAVLTAAEAISALTRYLNNATRGRAPVESAPQVDRVISALREASSRLPQLLSHLATATDRHAADPALYDDRRDRPGGDTADELHHRLSLARSAAHALTDELAHCQEASTHLGHDA